MLTVTQHRSEVTGREQFHDENQAVLHNRDCSVDIDRVGAPEAVHRVELKQKCFALVLLPPIFDLSPR